MRKVFSPVARFFGRRSKAQLGIMFVVLIGLCSLVLFNKSRLVVNLQSGEHLAANFAANYKLREYVSGVKVAGIKVGTVTAVARRDDGTVRVDMRVKPGTRQKLGAAPSARIRPTTILGGSGLSVYVDLRPSGDRGRFTGTIPADRTSLPVELDRVLEVLDDTARDGLAATLGALDTALAGGGGAALGRVLDQAPGTLTPAAAVVTSLGGQRRGDLTSLVTHLSRLSATLTAEDGEIEAVLGDAATATRTLGRRAADFEAVVADLPQNLAEARTGLDALAGTLRNLQATAPAARPAVAELEALLAAAEPVLAEARPLLADLRPLLAQLDPVLGRLTPTAALATRVLDDLDGPVMNRVQDPILTTFNAPYRGSKTLLHQEFAYLLAGLDGVFKYTDHSGAALRYQGGFSEGSLSGGRPAGRPEPGAVR